MNKSKEWQLAVAPTPPIPAGDTFIFKAGTEPKPEPTEIEAFKDAIRALTVLFQKKVDDCAEMEVRMHREIQALNDDLEGKKRVIKSMRGVEQILRDESERLFDENTALKADVEQSRKDAENWKRKLEEYAVSRYTLETTTEEELKRRAAIQETK